MFITTYVDVLYPEEFMAGLGRSTEARRNAQDTQDRNHNEHRASATTTLTRHTFAQKQTKNTYATHDPAFPYLLAFFLLLTSLAWSLAYAHASPAHVLRIAFFFVFVHCLAASLVVAGVMYVALPRLLGPKGLLVGRIPGGRRRGLFAQVEAGGVGEELEFGYCFDVSFVVLVYSECMNFQGQTC